MTEGLHISLAPYHLGDIAGFPITATLTTGWLVAVLIVVAAFLIGRTITLVPGRGQAALETVLLFGYGYVREVLEDDALARRFYPLLFSIFVYIATANILGLFPFIGAIGFQHNGHLTPLFYPLNTDLNATLGVTLVAFFAIEFAGIATLGVLRYGQKFVNLHSVIGFVVGIIELISEIARLITFSFRLFGNIFAGKVLILVALFFLPYLLPVPLVLYEAFVGVIQGAIFALLTLFFIKLAVTEVH